MANTAPIHVHKLAVIGDLHGYWDDADVRYFNASDVDLILFVGDLGSGTRRDGLEVIRSLAKLEKPTLVFAGNNDADHLPHLAAELEFQAGRASLLAAMNRERSHAPLAVGYSAYHFESELGRITLVAGRPLSRGGSVLGFGEVLERTHGVRSMQESTGRYRALVEQAQGKLVFLAHNGPTGLGESPDSPWGRDFDTAEGEPELPRDFGDADLRDAIDYARSLGKEVPLVVAGHMHRGRRRKRPLVADLAGTQCVNAAFVPRISAGEDGSLHHYVEIQLSSAGITAEDRFVELN